MDFDATMNKYAIGYAGLKQLLANYSLSVNNALGSVKATQIESSGGHPRVKIDYTLLGKPLSTETKLVQLDDRWYRQDMLNSVREAHQPLTEPVPPMAAGPASASTGPAGAASAPAAAASGR